MGNLSNFIGSGGSSGGGGLLNQTKYSTGRALFDSDVRRGFTNISLGPTVAQGADLTALSFSSNNIGGVRENQLIDGAITNGSGGTAHGTITANTASATDGSFSVTLVGNTAALGAGATVFITQPFGSTVNPATDLGLSDGDLLGYFMIGGGLNGRSFNQAGGNNENSTGGRGGNILQGTIPIVTAATDLTLTIGLPTLASTIIGGLTLSTVGGSNQAGWGAAADFNGTSRSEQSSAGPGINGYGVGGGAQHQSGENGGLLSHGFGTGGYAASAVNDQTLIIPGSDGAIIFFY